MKLRPERDWEPAYRSSPVQGNEHYHFVEQIYKRALVESQKRVLGLEDYESILKTLADSQDKLEMTDFLVKSAMKTFKPPPKIIGV